MIELYLSVYKAVMWLCDCVTVCILWLGPWRGPGPAPGGGPAQGEHQAPVTRTGSLSPLSSQVSVPVSSMRPLVSTIHGHY